jgi:hypothetical protein
MPMNDLQTYYQSFTDNSHIIYNNTTEAEHSWVTPDGVSPCFTLAAPFINNCSIDPEQTFLTMFYRNCSTSTCTSGLRARRCIWA